MVELEASLGDILIVDDNPGNLTVLLSMLSNAGYRVRSAINGEMALSAIEAARPDLVLLDVNMPGMNGLDVCRAIKQNPATADIPVICASALRDFSDKQAAFECGASDYVTKPFQFTEVFARVQTHITLRRQQQEIAALQQTLEQRDLELVIEREKLQYLQQMYSIFAHGIRAEMTLIRGYLQLIRMEKAEHGIDEFLSHIERNALGSSSLLSDFNFIIFGPRSKQVLETHSDDINSMVKDLIELKWESADSEKLKLEVNTAPRPFVIEADVNHLYWALKVVVESSVSTRTKGAAATLRVYDNRDTAVFEIEVSPVSEEDLSRVFTNPSAPTLVQNIVKLHNGRIEIERVAETGGIFRILLPLLRN